MKKTKTFEPAVFIPAAVLVFIGVGYAIFAGDQAESVFTALRDTITVNAGWVYSIGVGAFLIAAVVVALSDWGRIKLGPDDSEPEYPFLPWFAMMFSAGMGIGIMFFGVAEPITHFIDAPYGNPETVEAAEQAMVFTFFHWGIHAWAIYVIVGLSLAYFSFRHGLPLTIRSSLYPLIGERIYGPIGHAVDVIAILGTLFGVATSMGYGVSQINAGLDSLFGIGISREIQVGLIVIITAMATTSVLAGLDSGIKRLSEINLYLAIALMLFVLIAGPTLFLISAYVQNIGDYLDQLALLTFNVDAYGDGAWVNSWTLFYWGWWISWSPFVGMFIARVSRGRTIREFILGALLGPTLFTFLWMTIYGNAALREVLADSASPILEVVRSGDTPLALFAFLETLPFPAITSTLAIILVTTFFVTSSDSGSLVKSTLASGGALNPPVWQRFFWAVLRCRGGGAAPGRGARRTSGRHDRGGAAVHPGDLSGFHRSDAGLVERDRAQGRLEERRPAAGGGRGRPVAGEAETDVLPADRSRGAHMDDRDRQAGPRRCLPGNGEAGPAVDGGRGGRKGAAYRGP